MASEFKEKLIETVAANDTEESLFGLSNGQEAYIRRASGSAVYSSEVKVEILWGDDVGGWEVIFVTHGDKEEEIDEHFTGDGTKDIKLKLTNDSSNAETCSIRCEGDK